MQQRNCGKSDLILSALGLGCWAFGGGDYWGKSDQQNVNQVVQRALDLGITYFDTAEAYNDGRSEEFLGVALQEIPRDQVVVGTKISPSNLYPEVLVEHCEASLRRLGMDYIDLYMIHWPIHPLSIAHATKDPERLKHLPVLEDAVHTLVKLQEQGKIRYLGVSNFGVRPMREIQALEGEVVANQLGYSLLFRAAELEILPYCQQTGVGVIAYMTLMQALLTDKYTDFDEIPDWHKRTRHFNCNRTELSRHGEEGAEAETLQALKDIRAIAEQYKINIADIALNWATYGEGVTCALVGTQNISRLEANANAVAKPLPSELVEKLNQVTQALKVKLGPSLDLFEGTVNDRTK